MSYALPTRLYAPSADPNVSADVHVMWDDSELPPSGAALHELGHFQVAPLTRRYCPEFGLGSLPASAVRRHDTNLRTSTIRSEEYLASVLAAVWSEYTGVTTLEASLRALERQDRRMLRESLLTLSRWGLLDDEGRPQVRCRPPSGGHAPLTAERVRCHQHAHYMNGGGLWRWGSRRLLLSVVNHSTIVYRDPHETGPWAYLSGLSPRPSDLPPVPLWPAGGLVPDRYPRGPHGPTQGTP